MSVRSTTRVVTRALFATSLCIFVSGCFYADVRAEHEAKDRANRAAAAFRASHDSFVQLCHGLGEMISVPGETYWGHLIETGAPKGASTAYATVQQFSQEVLRSRMPVKYCKTFGNDAGRHADPIAALGRSYVRIGTVTSVTARLTGMGMYTGWAWVDGAPPSTPGGTTIYRSYQDYKTAEVNVPTLASEFLVLQIADAHNVAAMQAATSLFELQAGYCGLLVRDFAAVRAHLARFDSFKDMLQSDSARRDIGRTLLRGLQTGIAGPTAWVTYSGVPQELRDRVWSWNELVEDANSYGPLDRQSWEAHLRAGTLAAPLMPALGVQFCTAFYPDRDLGALVNSPLDVVYPPSQ